MGNPNYRVVIPTPAKAFIGLAEKVYQKHQELGAASPLTNMQSNTWETNGAKVAMALSLHDQAEALRSQAENLNKQRDLLLDEIKKSVRASRDVLMGIYSDNPRQLGEWGYEVNSSVSEPKQNNPVA